MIQRFLIYPVLILAAIRLVVLWRMGAGWHALQILQLFLVMAASAAGLWFSGTVIWLVAAWTLTILFIVTPRLLAVAASSAYARGNWANSARWWNIVSWIHGGNLGRIHRRYADALRAFAAGDARTAEAILEDVAARPMPVMWRGAALLWRMSFIQLQRDWERAVACYESVGNWGNWGLALRARLLAARAYAETGKMDAALRCLQLAAMSPQAPGQLDELVWRTRVEVAAIAGDEPELERLLSEIMDRLPEKTAGMFGSYWRGRCALVAGKFEEAEKHFRQAQFANRTGQTFWANAITDCLNLAQTRPALLCHRDHPFYLHVMQVLRTSDRQAEPWRALMTTRKVAPVMAGMLALLAVTYLTDFVFARTTNADLWRLAGNTAQTVHGGEWWRAVSALFLHANLLHLALNGAGLWMFGAAIERAWGWPRMLVVFLAAGVAGNVASAWHAPYDVAIGASGSVFGLIGAFAVAAYRLRGQAYRPLRNHLLAMLAVIIALDFTIGGLEPMVDNVAHVGGFLAGLVAGWWLAPGGERWFRQKHGHPPE